jgi:hypothetical protein
MASLKPLFSSLKPFETLIQAQVHLCTLCIRIYVYTNLYINVQSIFILCVLGGASARLEKEEESEES